MKRTTKLRQAMAEGIVVAPGSWDALSARMVEKLGYPAVYMTGWGVCTSSLGRADLTYITQTEMLAAAQRITEVVGIPLIADIDDGFGHVLHVQRTIERCQYIGVAAVQMEDMAAPKKCVNVGGANLIPAEEMVKKIQAAVSVKSDPDFTIIARTDNHYGIEELFRRAQMYDEAGADVIYPLGLTEKDDIAKLGKLVSKPMMIEQVGGGKTPQMSPKEAEEIGVRIFGFTLEGCVAAYRAQEAFLKSLLPVQEDHARTQELGPTFPELQALEDYVDIRKEEENQAQFFEAKK